MPKSALRREEAERRERLARQAPEAQSSIPRMDAPPPYDADRIMPVYFAAKAEAEKAVWKFFKDEKLPWVVNSVSPCVILGDLRDDRHLRSVPPQLVKQLYLGNIEKLQTPASKYYLHN